MTKPRKTLRGRLALWLVSSMLGLVVTPAAFGTPRMAAKDENDVATDLNLLISSGELKGSPVVNLRGDRVGRIEELFINPKSGRIDMFALSVDDHGRMIALPWSTISFEDETAILDASERQIAEAPPVDLSMLGGRQAVPKPAESTEPPPIETLRGYAPLSAYEKRFNPKTLEKLQGVIKGVVEAPLGEGKRVDEIAFLETSSQRGVLLALAPRWYLDQEGIVLDPADQIQVKGSRVDSDVGDIVVVTTLETKGRTIRLRTDQGADLWKNK